MKKKLLAVMLIGILALSTGCTQRLLIDDDETSEVYFEDFTVSGNHKVETTPAQTDEEGNVHYTEHKIEESIKKTENPAYIAEPLRTAYEVVYSISPYGHISQHIEFTYNWFGYDYRNPNMAQSWEATAEQIAVNEVSKENYKSVATNLLYCTVFLVGVCLIGYFAFRRKELK